MCNSCVLVTTQLVKALKSSGIGFGKCGHVTIEGWSSWTSNDLRAVAAP